MQGYLFKTYAYKVGFLMSIKTVFNNVLPLRKTAYKYYFTQLNDVQKSIYKSIYSGIASLDEEVIVPSRPVNEVSKVLNCVLKDNPLIFYCSNAFSYSNALYKKQGKISFEYLYSRHDTKAQIAKIMDLLSAFDSVKNKSEYEKVLAIHDYCLEHFQYDFADNSNSHTILGLILNKAAVCEGIAKFVKLAFDYLEMKSLVVDGSAMNSAIGDAFEAHTWNIVIINEKPYHLDVTFDMTIMDKTNRYDYFCLSDDDIKLDHTTTEIVPLCVIKDNDYYTLNSMLVKNPKELKEHISKKLALGEKNVVVKILNKEFSDEFLDKLLQVSMKHYFDVTKRNTSVGVRYNKTQMVFEIIFE
jgi:hypothetical protein